MRYERLWNNTTWYLSFLLGQASALLGLMITLGWVIALAVIVPPKGVGALTGPRLLLPIEPPLIGLALGGLGLLIARLSRQKVAGYSIAGLVFNALPLALAIVLIGLRLAM